MLQPAGESYRHPEDPGEPSTGDPRLSVTDMEADILAAFVAGRRVLEIGTGLGVSTRAMAGTADVVHTVDIDPWVQEVIWPTLPPNVTCGTDLSGQQFEAVFIDGDHSSDAVERDVATAMRHAGPGAVILAHDTGSDAVRAPLLAASSCWCFIPTTHGIGVLWL